MTGEAFDPHAPVAIAMTVVKANQCARQGEFVKVELQRWTETNETFLVIQSGKEIADSDGAPEITFDLYSPGALAALVEALRALEANELAAGILMSIPRGAP